METSELLTRDQLLNKRRLIRGQITRRCARIETLLNEELNQGNVDELTLNFRFLDENKRSLRMIQVSLEPGFEPQEVEGELISFEDYETRIEYLKIKNERHVAALCTNLSGQSNGNTSSLLLKPSHVTLPKLEIEPFTGEFSDWIAFWEDFQSTIHDNTSLNEVAKFKYLRSFLRGDPLKTVQNYELSKTGYELAIAQLIEDYAKPEKLQRRHIRAIHDLPSFRDAGDYQSVKNFESSLRKHVVALKRLQVNPDLFVQFVVPKMPKVFYQAFTTKHTDWQSAEELLTFLKTSLEALQTWDEGQASISNGRETWAINKRMPTAATLAVSTVGPHNASNNFKRPYTKFFCVICGSIEHGTRMCNSALTIQERKDILISKGRCVKCLRMGHQESSCDFPFEKCRHCDAQHFPSMCPVVNRNVLVKPSPTARIPEEKTSVAHASCRKVTSKEYLLRTAKVCVVNGIKRVTAYCLIDGGSQRSFIRASIAKELSLKVMGEESLITGAFGGIENAHTYERVEVKLEGFSVPNCITLQALVEELPSSHEIPVVFPHLQSILADMGERGLILANDYDHTQPIDLIIGMNFYNQIMTGQSIRLTKDVMVHESVFGWTVQGVLQRWDDRLINQRRQACGVLTTRAFNTLDEQLKLLWSLDNIGILSTDTMDKSLDKFEKEFADSTIFDNQRYSVCLPWREGFKEKLASNFSIAYQRLTWMLFRLAKDEEKFNNYALNIENYLKNEHSEQIFYDDLAAQMLIGFYLPHFAVYNEEKSTKTRIVFDASAHADGELSLNDCLDPGPDRSLDVVKVLYAFQSERWALTGYIKKAFLQIGLHEEDRDYVRYLWIDRSLPEEERKLKPCIFRMKLVLFGVSSSPALLKFTIKLHMFKFKKDYPVFVEKFLNGSYVDDLATSLSTVGQLQEMKEVMISALKEGGLEMHRVRTNHNCVDDWMKLEEEPEASHEVSVLGLKWNYKSDDLIVRIPDEVLKPDAKITKRGIISKASSIFDPKGWIAPLTMMARMIFQLMWVLQLAWDDKVTPEVEDRWRRWLKLVSQRIEWRLPRYNLTKHIMERGSIYELHVFCDASPKAFGAIAYLVSRVGGKSGYSSILQTRFRVAPIKPLSIPRLELLSALLASRMADYIVHNSGIQFDSRHFWSDSQIVLYWVTKYKVRSATFVNNKVAEINKLTSTGEWCFCPTAQNPADLATKASHKDPLGTSSIWWTGPMWLRQERSAWPQGINVEERYFPEIIKEERRACLTHVTVKEGKGLHLDKVIKINCFGSLSSLLRVTVAFLRKIHNFRKLEITEAELYDKAELIWIKQVQYNTFRKDINQLNKVGCVATESNISRLCPFLDEQGIIRLRTRLDNGDFDDGWAQPILLPANVYFTELYVRYLHNENLHCGLSTILFLLRQKFWVIGARKLCKQIIQGCWICARYQKKHYVTSPSMLPSLRTADVAPFAHIGLDFAGPIYLTVGKKDFIKGYIALFTCAVTRAIHLELTYSLKALDVVDAIRRFCARRGVPSLVYSDNARTFKKTASLLEDALQIEDPYLLESYLAKKRIRWMNIVERAPWWGGFWERLVGSIKAPLKRVLGKATLSPMHFQTLLCEVEAVVNARPLMTLYDDVDEFYPLSPADLVIGRSLSQLAQYDALKAKDQLVATYQHRSKYFTQYIHAWKRAYLQQLRSLHVSDSGVATDVKIGDFAILDESPLKAQLWPIVRVEKLLKGGDGHVRACLLRTQDGRTINRAVKLLVQLPGERVETKAPGSVK